ncbi:MAG: glycosyltransferase family 2 protein [Bacteroidia bacterium]
MNVSIIIPTKNRASILEEAISHLFTVQKYPLENFEVIVVNDGDLLPGKLLQRYPNVKIIKNNGSGAGNARNTGADIAKNELLLFIDDDMLIGDNCISLHIELHKKFDRALVSGSWVYGQSMINLLVSSPFGRYKLKYDYKSLEGKNENMIAPGIYSTNSLASFNLSIYKKDFWELGGFNVNFPFAGCEDQEFTMRAIAKGYKLLLDANNICINNEKDRIDLNKWLMRQYTGVQGYVLLCDLFPFRKKEVLYYENAPINSGDSLRLKLKKEAKYMLSSNIVLPVILYITRLSEKLKINDSFLFRLYNALCGLYLYKGFRYSCKVLANSNKTK